MLINFDVDRSLFAFMREDSDKQRWYYAIGDPRVVLRLDGFSLDAVSPGEWCDGLVGWDRGDAGYVLPQHVGARHTKITLKRHGVREFGIDTPPTDLKMMSAILADAPRQAVRFDARAIADETISMLTDHVSRLSHRLSIGGWLPGMADGSNFVPLRTEIEELCRVANGEIDRAAVDGDFVMDTHQLLQDIAELCAWWWDSSYDIPQSWRETPLGRAWDAARYWLMSDDMITLSAAAMLLYGRSEPAYLNKIDRMIEQQKLSAYIDPAEGNPRRARRVLASEVKALK